ncbi:aminotransferase class I/II-fold pyridoxal phosphate-dependent enzyme [Roseateles sp. DAIF2]|uniref:aminotransferase class I/II-fold pyridoxal phosphate-dependent enzyme n=1 Tax=Roseateles sp. DAIF2 TaxID=2714952 RepID=UPI0018A2E89F|nr:aminotransferase class I/II-fold pyridoxal phosphate-dependent enzyme [Roseateles sp. DAIF2]QPF73617.1 aminotransferase class I/II-fold pyridoxal phosphate-dependent enzyme [Roseateles sp. DAIF2]
MSAIPQDPVAAVRAVVKKHSQYDDETLRPQSLLQEDLGIDSIMLAAIVSELNQLFQTSVRVEINDSDTLDSLCVRFGATPAAVAASAAPLQTMRDFVANGSDTDVFAKTRRFARFHRERAAQGHFWYGMASRGRSSNRALIHDTHEGRDREFLLFASNNYLGLANDERVLEAIIQATREYGATNTGSRLIAGTTELHRELERRLAQLKGREDCIVFPSGYSANLGSIAALVGPGDQVIGDVYNHMSIQDGCKLAGAARRLYPHNDMQALEALLARSEDEGGGRLIVADGVFSMHGDIVRLPELSRLARRYQARLLIDDAHSTGVLGLTGSGTTEHFDMKGQVDLEVGTMSKALGGQGGFVVGDAEVIDYLRFYANSYVFAATIPAPVVAGLLASLDLMAAEPQRLARLWSNIGYLKKALDELGFDTEDSQSAIIPVRLGDEALAMNMGRSLRRRGMYCQTVVFPGVAVGDARLRISVLESHTAEDLNQAIQILLDAARENGLVLQPARAAA